MFVALKHANREVKHKIKAGRDKLHLEKCKVDLSRLQLQNLLYEVSHLKKEIVRCQKFKSRDTNLELLSETEYASKLPSFVRCVRPFMLNAFLAWITNVFVGISMDRARDKESEYRMNAAARWEANLYWETRGTSLGSWNRSSSPDLTIYQPIRPCRPIRVPSRSTLFLVFAQKYPFLQK